MPNDDPQPFWRQEPPADDSIPGETASDTPAEKTNEPPQTITVGGHEFTWTEGVRAEVTLSDEEGNNLGTIFIPYDPDNQPPEEEVFAQANQLFHDMEFMRSIVEEDAIDALVANIHKSGTGERGRSLAEEMVAIVADILADGLKLTVTDDDGSDGLTPDQLKALATEGERLFNEQLPQLVRDLAMVEVEGGRTFWHQFARDIIATATLHARDDVADEMGGREVVEAFDDAGFDDFERRVLEAYRTGPYLAGAMFSLTRQWTQVLAESVSSAMSTMAEKETEEGREFADVLIKAARKSLGLPEHAKETPQAITSAFNAEGYGRTDNSVFSIGGRHALSAGCSRWNFDVEGFPVFAYENASGKALYSPMRSHFPTTRDAMRAVENYGPLHVAMLKYITAKHLANSSNKTSGPYGGFYMGIEEFLEFRGIKKQSAGGYRTEDRREVVELVEALEHIEVAGNIEGYERGKRGKKSTLTIRSPLIVVSQRVTQPGMLGGEERPIAWYLRAGDWASELDRFGLQFAVTTQALLQLNTQNDMHAFNIGNHLTEEYRIRANQRSWAQPYRVHKLLDGAEIEVDRKNPGRFRKRIEAALDVLSNPFDMQNTPIIKNWEYAQEVEAKGRGWLDRWLVSGIIITPPPGLITPYESIGRRRSPRKLAS
jgi:hypothetical protein